MKSFRIHVIGRVQGVFFRRSTKDKADSLGLCGWVRNEPDGSVMIEVEGQESVVEKFVEWCKIGPPIAHVEAVNIKELPLQNYTDFKVLFS